MARVKSVVLAAMAALSLAGCAPSSPIRAPVPPAEEEVVAPGKPAAAAREVIESSPSLAPTSPAQSDPQAAPTPRITRPSFWKRFRARLAFTRCGEPRGAARWVRIYARDPRRFEAMIARSLPLLEYVEGELERAGLPAEFALLPMVESSYTPVATRGNRPAGIWQFMPGTARAYGLRIDEGYDGRLDNAAATRAAVAYLATLGRFFEGDFILANMGFNAGEHRVRRAVSAAASRGAWNHETLALSPITHEHYAKLAALSCLVRAPRAHDIVLPRPTRSARLRAVFLDAPTDVTLLQALSGLDERRFRAVNAAFRARLAPAGAGVLLSASNPLDVTGTLAALGPARAGAWSRRSGELERIAQRVALSPALIAAVNPGREGPGPWLVPGPAATITVAPAEPGAAHYVVRAGDSLWSIARRFRIALEALRALNGLDAEAVLRPGQRLRLRPDP